MARIRKLEDGEFEQREYHNKLLADDFCGMSIEEMEEECEFYERERDRCRRMHGSLRS